MKSLPSFCTLLCLLLLSVCPSALADPLILPQYGFQIDPLDVPATATPTQAIMLFLPPTKGFAPNVNVMMQPYASDLTSYIALSKKQFDQANLKVISDQAKGDSEWAVEYAGSLGTTSLHWYARAVLGSGKVYLVTATAKEEDWATLSGTLKKCVDSFKTK